MNFEGQKQPKTPEDVFQAPRAQRTDETTEEYRAANPEFTAAQNQQHQEKMAQAEIKKEDQKPTPEQLKAQQERDQASQMVAAHFSGKSRIPDGILTPEETQVLSQMETLYKQQKAANPDQPVKFGLDDKTNETYARILHRLPLAIQEHGHTQRDRAKADKIREQLGIQTQKKEPSLLTKYFNEPAELALEELEQRKAMAMKAHGHEDDAANITATIEEIKKRQGAEKKIEMPSNTQETKRPDLSVEERKKLSGWQASYELAKTAKQQGVDLTNLSREEYAQFAIKNSLAIDDDQLRFAPQYRILTSNEEWKKCGQELRAGISEEADKAFNKFCFEIKTKAGEQNRNISEGVRVRSGTAEKTSWLFFGINKGAGGESDETHKSYISLKDLNTLTPDKFTSFMKKLKDAGYNGDIKIFQDMANQGVRLNDQIVMHGSSETDAKLAMQTAESFFGDDLDQKSTGKDEVIDGKNMSYSQTLAKKIKDSVNSQ